MAVVPKFGAADDGDANQRQRKAGNLPAAELFLKPQHAHHAEPKDLQTVEQRGNARPHGINAFVPQRQIKREKHARQQGKADGARVFGQFLREKTHQQRKNHGGDGKPPKGNRVGAHVQTGNNHAAQSKDNAADNQTEGSGFGREGGHKRQPENKGVKNRAYFQAEPFAKALRQPES